MIEEAARRLAAGTDPGVVPERFLIGAARIALDRRLARPERHHRELLPGPGEAIAVSLPDSVAGLHRALQALGEELDGSRLTIVEDRPRGAEVVLVDELGDGIDDMVGWVEEAAAGAAAARDSAAHPPDAQGLFGALAACQGPVDRAADTLHAALLADWRIADVGALGRERGGEWLAWSGGVELALRRVEAALTEVAWAFVACWRDLAERVSASLVSVTNNSIGQQITTPTARARTPRRVAAASGSTRRRANEGER